MLITVVTLLLAGSAAANPISSERLAVQQVAGTHHVQVTWAEEGNASKPRAVTRDGEELEVSWVAMDGVFQGNTGSGLVELDAFQFCDCKVAVGAHEYGVGEYTTSLEVVESYDGPDEVGDTAMPWVIPEPAGQGLDCPDTCGDATEPMPEPTGCATSPAGPVALLLLPLLLLVRRRR